MDLASYLDKPTAIVGTTGAGKTFAAKGAVEQLLRLGRRVIIIDPTGAWWGLRAGADGKQTGGFPVVIFGGDHADVPVSPDAEAGKALALALAERDVQAIIDTSEMTGGEKNRFLTPFLENLYARNKAALHLIVDEADEVAAQRLADGEQRLFGAFDKIVRRGRLKGFRPLMISQRPAVIHKNVLSQIGTLIALKLTSPQDRKAIEEWVKGNADSDQARAVMQSLSTLARGEGWVWSPADGVLERTVFPAIQTFDSSRTPEHDEAVVAPALTAVDVAGLREALAVRTDRKDGQAIASDPDPQTVAAAERRGYEEGMRAGTANGYCAGWRECLAAVSGAVGKLQPTEQDARPLPLPPEKAAKPQRALMPKQASAPDDPLLSAALQVWPAKMTWAGLAAMCDRKARGGHFNTVRKRLLAEGLMREEGAFAVPTNPPETPEGTPPADLLEANLPQPSQKMFAAIRRAPGLSVEALADKLAMQPRGGHWNTGMSTLRKNGLIVESNGLRLAPGLEAQAASPSGKGGGR